MVKALHQSLVSFLRQLDAKTAILSVLPREGNIIGKGTKSAAASLRRAQDIMHL